MGKKLYVKIIVLVTIFLSIIVLKDLKVNADVENNNPMLKDIKINGKEIEPKFEMFTTEYVVVVNENIETAKIEATPDDLKAKVEIIGNEELRDGRNEFEIKVTAEDGETEQSYFIYITKGDANKANANLKSLKVENYDLAPLFEKNTIDYALEYPKDLQKLNVEAVPEDENAKIEIIGNEKLTNKFQKIEVKVVAVDKQTVKKYYITAKKVDKTKMETAENEDNEDMENIDGQIEIDETNNKAIVDEKGKEKNEIISIAILLAIGVILAWIIIKRKNKGDKR